MVPLKDQDLNKTLKWRWVNNFFVIVMILRGQDVVRMEPDTSLSVWFSVEQLSWSQQVQETEPAQQDQKLVPQQQTGSGRLDQACFHLVSGLFLSWFTLVSDIVLSCFRYSSASLQARFCPGSALLQAWFCPGSAWFQVWFCLVSGPVQSLCLCFHGSCDSQPLTSS